MKYGVPTRIFGWTFVAWIMLVNCSSALSQTLQGSPQVQMSPAPSAKSASSVAPVSYVSVPFTSLPRLGFPVVQVRLNGRITTDFVVDTGATCFCIRPEIAAKLELKTKTMTAPEGSDPKFVGKKFEFVTLDHFNIGNAADIQVDALVSDSIWGGYPDSVGGIIGGNFFANAKLAVLFDFEQQYIHMVVGGKLTPEQVKYMGIALADNTEGIPVKSDSDGQLLYVPVTVGMERHLGSDLNASKPVINQSSWLQNVDLVIDSGNVRTTAVVTDLPPDEKPIRGSVASLASGSIPLDLYKVDFLRIGQQSGVQTVTRPDSVLAISPFVCGIANSKFEHTLSIYALGMDFLSRFRVLIDYPARRLYLTPVPHDAQTLYPTNASRENAWRSTDSLSIRPRADGNWEIVDLSSDSAFSKAGARPGDVLLTANGIKLANLLPDEVLALLKSEKKLSFEVLRDGKSSVNLQFNP